MNIARLNTALVRHGADRGWLRFEDPVEAVTVWDQDGVLDAVQLAEDHAEAGRWVVGLLSYDAGPAFDAAVASRRDPSIPLVAFGVFGQAAATSGPIDAPFEISEWTPDQDEATYAESIASIREYIRSGDTYQVNYTTRRHANFWGSAEGLFASLVRAQMADYDGFLHLGGNALCSPSPEMFFIRDGRTITSRPMKGTRPRHHLPEIDSSIADELRSSLKDRAENVMIVDMVRNDLGRIAEPGSVQVPDLLTVEHYPTVHTMTSTVTAESDADLVTTLKALYPVASITGAPKYRTTEIIAELEATPRGAYCGSVFTLSPHGRWEFNVVIRSVWLDLESGTGTYGVGGGIVWDSDPHDEWRETEHKSRVLARAGKPLRLLETMAWTPDGGVTLRQRHINRLLRSGDHFGIRVDMEAVMDLLNSVRSDTPALLRLLVDSTGHPELQIGPLPHGDSLVRTLPIDSLPTDPYDEFLVHKTTNRLRYQEALSRFPEARDVVLWNDRGELTETCIANLVLEVDGELVTPHHRSGLLAGTLREELIERDQVREEVLTVADLLVADRVFTVNSVRGWDEVMIDPGMTPPTASMVGTGRSPASPPT